MFYDHENLLNLNRRSLSMQRSIRAQTFSPEDEKTLRLFSSSEVENYILKLGSPLRNKIRDDPSLPQGLSEKGTRWFSLEEINELRRRIRINGKPSLMPKRPQGRAVRVAVTNFKGGVGKTVVAQHFAHAAALDGYRVLVVDFDPQATLTHSLGLVDVREHDTVWGIICRDLCREADRIANTYPDVVDCPYPTSDDLPGDVQDIGRMRADDFIKKTCWPTIDVVPSCANAAFVEFASAQYRGLHAAWTFFGCVDRFLNELSDDRYDLIVFDCPPAIGYQSLNAAYAADILYIPSGPGYWEYDSTTSYLGQLGGALEELFHGFSTVKSTNVQLPKKFIDIRILMTRFESSNDLHQQMKVAFDQVFESQLCDHHVDMTRAVEQSGRFSNSVYEQDPRDMTKKTWVRARASFDAAYGEFRTSMLRTWEAALAETEGAVGLSSVNDAGIHMSVKEGV